jgi:hypothetical protein
LVFLFELSGFQQVHLQLLLVVQQLYIISKLVFGTSGAGLVAGGRLREHHKAIGHSRVVAGLVFLGSTSSFSAFFTLADAIGMTYHVSLHVSVVANFFHLIGLRQKLSLLSDLIVNGFYSHLSCEIFS